MQVGDLVMIKREEGFDDSGDLGIVKWLDAGQDEPNPVSTCGISMIATGRTEVYLQKFVEVISASR